MMGGNIVIEYEPKGLWRSISFQMDSVHQTDTPHPADILNRMQNFRKCLWWSALGDISPVAEEKTIVSTFGIMKSQSPGIKSPKIYKTSSDVH